MFASIIDLRLLQWNNKMWGGGVILNLITDRPEIL